MEFSARRGATDQVARASQAADNLDWQVVGTEVRSGGSDGEGDVDPVVDDAERATVAAHLDDPDGELVQLAVRAALTPHLHHTGTGTDC